MKLCLIIHDIEELKQGVIIIASISNSSIKRIAVAFVDNISFYINGEEYQKKIQAIVERYVRLYEATRGKVE